jgi:hypothetical protein
MLGALLGCASTTVSHDDRAPVTKKHNKHQGLREDQVVKFATGMGAGIPLGFLLLIGVCSL